jgi:hypothetical protein
MQIPMSRVAATKYLLSIGPIALAVLLIGRLVLPVWGIVVLGIVSYLGFLALVVCWLAGASQSHPDDE